MKVIIVILLVLALGIFAGKYFSQTIQKKYYTENKSIVFNYPTGYFLDDTFTADRSSHTVTLTDSTLKQNSSLRYESLPAIIIRIYEKTNQATLDQWLTIEREDSWVASKGSFSKTTISGFPALMYEWKGTRNGDAFAVEVGSKVYVFTVSYKEKTDLIRSDFYKIMSAVQLKKI